MSKPAPLSSMSGEFAGLVSKGEAAPAPAAAIALPPEAAASSPVRGPRAPRPAEPAARDVLRPPARRLERAEAAPAAPRASARIQVALRMAPERHEQLARASFILRMPAAVIVNEVLNRWLDSFEQGRGVNEDGSY